MAFTLPNKRLLTSAQYAAAFGAFVGAIGSDPSDDIRQLVAQLGGTAAVAAVYDRRRGVTSAATVVTQWDDARGATGFGPSLASAGAARPTYTAAAGVAFDGVQQYLRGTNGLAGIVDSCWFACTGTLVYNASAFVCFGEIGNGATRCVQGGATNANQIFTIGPGGTSVMFDVTGLTGRRVSHHRDTQSGGNGVRGVQVGSAAEATTTIVETLTAGANRLTLGATTADTPASFSAITLAAVVVGIGAYSAAQRTTVNNWAAAYHGATL